MDLFRFQDKYGNELVSQHLGKSGPEIIKLFSCSTQPSMKYILLTNFKILTIFLKLLSCSTQLSSMKKVLIVGIFFFL